MTICAETFSMAGLVLNLAGVVMLFSFGMPRLLRLGGKPVVTANPTPESKRKENLHECLSYFGLALIVLGTFTQIVANYI